MPSYIQFSDEELLEMKRMYIDGESTTSISERYGICRVAVSLRLRKMGVVIRKRSAPSRANPELMDRVKWLRMLGVSWKEIEKETQLTQGYLHEILRREKAAENDKN